MRRAKYVLFGGAGLLALASQFVGHGDEPLEPATSVNSEDCIVRPPSPDAGYPNGLVLCINSDHTVSEYPMQQDIVSVLRRRDGDSDANIEMAVSGYGVKDDKVVYYFHSQDGTLIEQQSCADILSEVSALAEAPVEAMTNAIASLLPQAFVLANGDPILTQEIASSQAFTLARTYQLAAQQCALGDSPQPLPAPEAKENPADIIPMPQHQAPFGVCKPQPGVAI